MGKVRCIKITTAAFEALTVKDENALYFVNDTGTFGPLSMETNGRVYLGNKLLSSFSDVMLASGHKVYYNGNDVTNSASLGSIIANAKGNWYGSWGAYKELRDANPTQIQAGVAYHIFVQADWEEDDPTSLAYIPNKPDIMDLTVSSGTAKFFYR